MPRCRVVGPAADDSGGSPPPESPPLGAVFDRALQALECATITLQSQFAQGWPVQILDRLHGHREMERGNHG